MNRNVLVLILIALAAVGVLLLLSPGIAQITITKTYYVPGYATSSLPYVTSTQKTTSSTGATSGTSSSSSSSGTSGTSGGTSAYFDNDWFWNGNYLYANPNATAVGIGTETPKYKLDVYGNIRAYAAAVLADYFVITSKGTPTGWKIEYNPTYRALEIEYTSNGKTYNMYFMINPETGKLELNTNGGDINATGGIIYATNIVLTGSLDWKINYTEPNKELTFWYWNGTRWVKKFVIGPLNNVINASSLTLIVKNITAPEVVTSEVRAKKVVVEQQLVINNQKTVTVVYNNTNVVFNNVTATKVVTNVINTTNVVTNVLKAGSANITNLNVTNIQVTKLLNATYVHTKNVAAGTVGTSQLFVYNYTFLYGSTTINGQELYVVNLPYSTEYQDVLVYNPTTGQIYYAPINELVKTSQNAWLWNGNYIYANPAAAGVGIGTETPHATLEVNGTFRVSGPNERYFMFYFGVLNDFEFNGSALIIHPAWGPSGYNPSALLYLSGNVSNFKVGIGTDHPEYKLDVAGNIRAIGSTVLADYFQFTEAGNPTNFRFDYFPNTPIGNVIGLAYYNGTTWRPVMAIDQHGYVFTPRLYITEEGQELSPKWFLDYNPSNGRLTFVYAGGNMNSYNEKMWLLPSGTLYVTSNLHLGGSIVGVHTIYGQANATSITFSPNSWINITGRLKVEPWAGALTSPPKGWGMGVWTWDVYAEGSVGVGRNGNLVAWISGTLDGQGFIYLNNTNNGAWARISRWTDRLEILSSNAIALAIGQIGNDIVWLNSSGLYIHTDIYAGSHSVYADYYWFTEFGKKTGMVWDFVPGSSTIPSPSDSVVLADTAEGYGILFRIFRNGTIVGSNRLPLTAIALKPWTIDQLKRGSGLYCYSVNGVDSENFEVSCSVPVDYVYNHAYYVIANINVKSFSPLPAVYDQVTLTVSIEYEVVLTSGNSVTIPLFSKQLLNKDTLMNWITIPLIVYLPPLKEVAGNINLSSIKAVNIVLKLSYIGANAGAVMIAIPAT